MVVAGTIGFRTAFGGRLMNYDEFFADAIGRLPDRTSGPPPSLLRPSRSPKLPKPECASEPTPAFRSQADKPRCFQSIHVRALGQAECSRSIAIRCKPSSVKTSPPKTSLA